MSKRGLEDKIKYSQPHNIHINTGNEALDQKLVEYLHSKAKYEAKYRRSKNSRRLYN